MNTSITPEQARARRRSLSDQNVAPFYTMSCDSKYADFGDTEQHQTGTRVITENQPSSAETFASV